MRTQCNEIDEGRESQGAKRGRKSCRNFVCRTLLIGCTVLWVADPRIDPSLGMIEVIQEVGETIFVPQGWWHCVLNLGLTVAATENVMLKEMLSEPFVDTLRALTPEHTAAWLRQLSVHRPELMNLVGNGAAPGGEREKQEARCGDNSDDCSDLSANENGAAALGITAQTAETEGALRSAVDEI